MPLTPHASLCAAEIAFFAPVLLTSAFVCFRHGFKKQLGWLYLVLLSLLRLIGCCCLLAADTMPGLQEKTIVNLMITYSITNSVGTAPLLLALMGFMQRINDGMHHAGLPALTFRPIHLISLAALIIVIVGGTDEAEGVLSQKTGQALIEAGSLLFLAVYIALASITLLTVTRMRWVLPSEIILTRAAVLSLPFLAVRLAYTIAVAWTSNTTSPFYRLNVNVYVQAFMQFAMEAIVVVIYVTAGLRTPKAELRELREGVSEEEARKETYSMEDLESQEMGRTGPMRPEPAAARPEQERPHRNIGDYRPSRMIANAIRESRR